MAETGHDNKHAVKLQVCTILLVTGLVVLFEIAIYVKGVVPTAQKALSGMLWGVAGTKRTPLTQGLDGWLELLEARERPLVEANNSACLQRGAFVVLLPLLLFGLMFYHYRDLRQTPLGGVWRDTGISVVLIVVLQISFFMMGMRWMYPSASEYVYEVAKQYRAEVVADGDAEPVADERMRQLWH